ncbi:MAG: PAS domain-containing protein [Limisphaerales bacterium]
MKKKSDTSPPAVKLRRHAEAQLRDRRGGRQPGGAVPKSEDNAQRLFHELQVHQIELEMQNSELRQARDNLEVALEEYTDLYDFAPVGYFTLTADGTIQFLNLTGAALVGIERSKLVGQSLGKLFSAEHRPGFNSFLKQIFASPAKQSANFDLLCPGELSKSVNIEAQRLLNGKECRAVMIDITNRKRAEAAQRRLDVITASNQKLELEIVQRQAVETALKQSEQRQIRLLAESRYMQEQLRQLSRQVLHAQEEERKRISRELHDVIAQTLTASTSGWRP